MDFDVMRQLGAVDRSVSSVERNGMPARAVTLSRGYATSPNDLWAALTDPLRLAKWFLPVEGDLREGGSYRLEGNAEGTITGCDPPVALDLTWEYGGETSWVEVRLSAEGEGRTRLTITHVAPVTEHWRAYGPGATGIGWDLGLVGLLRHLADSTIAFDEAGFSASAAGRAFIEGSGKAWAEADIANHADPSRAREAARRTIAFFVNDARQEES